MTAIDITLTLPEELVEKARAAGILTDDRMTELLQKELERQDQVGRFFEDIEKLHTLHPSITQEEIDDEIRAYKTERRAKHESRNDH